MSEPRQRRAFIPGADDSEEESSAPSSRSVYERYKNWSEADQRREERARVAAWMTGIEPREWWEVWEYSNTRVFCMEFPGSVHYFVAAFEKVDEMGKLFAWC